MHRRTYLTLGIIGGLAAYSMYLGWTEAAWLLLGALVGYLGKLNGAS